LPEKTQGQQYWPPKVTELANKFFKKNKKITKTIMHLKPCLTKDSKSQKKTQNTDVMYRI